MNRFLFTTWPFPGHFFAQIAIADALRERGHQCAFYTGIQACRVLEDETFKCFPFKHLDEEKLYQVMFSQQRGSWEWKEIFRFQATLSRWLLDTIPQQVQDLEAVLTNWRPDVIVCDPTMWSPILIFHEKLGIPVAVSSFVPACMLPGPDAPPFGLGLPPPHKLWTRLLALAVRTATDVLGVNFRRTANGLRQRYGLRPLTTSVSAHTGQMPLYLVPSAPEFDYKRRDLPPSVHYVGPCIWNKPRREPPATWLAELPRNQSWVHVTEGTMHVKSAFVLRAAAKGLANLPMQVIMTTGGNREPGEIDLLPIAGNIHIVRWVSHSELLPKTNVVVTTGGAGTVLAALHAGVPMVIVPTEWDKPEIAQRVVEAGAGIRLSPARCTPKRLRAAVERVLEEPSFKQNAQRLATIFSQYGGPDRAAELLEKLNINKGVVK